VKTYVLVLQKKSRRTNTKQHARLERNPIYPFSQNIQQRQTNKSQDNQTNLHNNPLSNLGENMRIVAPFRAEVIKSLKYGNSLGLDNVCAKELNPDPTLTADI
jgi:hypothetical protein